MKKIILFLLFVSTLCFAQKAQLKKEISKITSGKNATVAVSVLGIDFPFQYNNVNADKKLPMLSVFKFHIACATLHLVDEEKLDLNQRILVKKSDLLDGTWSPFREKYPDGKESTLAELINYMVARSDNNITDVILKLIGGTEVVQNFMNSKGVQDFQIKNNEEKMHQGAKFLYENYTTTKSMTKLLKNFYEDKIISKKSTDFLMNIMLETSTGTTKLVEQLPPKTVAHKTGSSGKVGDLTIAENDVGIVMLPSGKHYAITVFVIDSKEDDKTNQKMVSDISKVVYDLLN